MTSKETARPLRVLQLTDPHLMASADGALLGVNTRDSLNAVIAEVLASHGQPDLILATGDLAQDGSEEAYCALGESFTAFNCASAWIAGNHDKVPSLKEVAARYGANRRHLVQGGWQFILLDSSVPGKVHGELAESELGFLVQMLEQNPDVPTLVTLHHHPVDIDTDWMADIGLRNREEFWQLIDRFPQVKIVLWGHIHQTFEQQRNGVHLLATPSTCIQFTSGSRKFSVDDLAPGYRWFELQASGDFTTEVCRARSFEFELDQNSTGY
ncbi:MULTISPECIES: 3',5'-cyclic-AMP phosphodiesterase [Marinobacter]|uniref:3',5'-cyclic-AMP phosphodiesterase n=1 Tax=Marinobacter xiaoshiensis TaxID=3073652 RepID=A0ABU2HHS4_9GAMM|nr:MULTISPECIES: 3',5'-cyclic-AMP phosphodiesterase [unclassified Marinobacter]MBK1874729.1 3',5'-cyclic-AMP phosphodiesterase [Marinobacter sp. 1-3A]MBK1888171.1 3',5'-cyclic-AMP phosphodiesterase [Marinobacter sp. DY40_1A1]MDS1310627.1 3',5'-cyclic-AMP phosphodiesterase [Marinobacter sp. F60267]